jgi:predicted Rossmann-fold nucleotide-binding protein
MAGVQVAVIGSGAEHEERAEAVGRLLAERGCTVVTGGLGEVMAASEWVDHEVVTGVGHARNLAVVASGDAVIAIGGRWGTLAEIAFAHVLERPVVILDPGLELEGVTRAGSPEEAVELALRLAGGAG